MKVSLRRLAAAPLAAGALALALLTVNVAPAGAASAAVAQVNGAGTISPALTLTQTPRSHAFTFTSTTITTTGIVNNAPVVLAPSSCGASGASIAEVYAGGVGTGNWSCSSGVLAGRSGGLVYARVGEVVPVAITGGINGALVCIFTPGSPPPGDIANYTLLCAGAGASTA